MTINLINEARSLAEYWSPKIVGELNDQYIKVARVKGEFTWHKHDHEDELFIILQGELTIQYEDREVTLFEGDAHVVPKGVMHNPVCDDECLIALIEPKVTLHTGDVVSDKTKSIEDQLSL